MSIEANVTPTLSDYTVPAPYWYDSAYSVKGVDYSQFVQPNPIDTVGSISLRELELQIRQQMVADRLNPILCPPGFVPVDPRNPYVCRRSSTQCYGTPSGGTICPPGITPPNAPRPTPRPYRPTYPRCSGCGEAYSNPSQATNSADVSFTYNTKGFNKFKGNRQKV